MIDFNDLLDLVNKVSVANNGTPAKFLHMSRKIFEENIEEFKSGYWRGLKVEVIENVPENMIYVLPDRF